jgi:hypothetical protein
MYILQSLLYLTTALHVSGVTMTHRQEHITTVTTASGNRYTVLSAEELELVCVCCGWRRPPTTHSNQFQLLHDSSRQHYGVTVTRYCSYSCFVFVKMGDSETRSMSISFQTK